MREIGNKGPIFLFSYFWEVFLAFLPSSGMHTPATWFELWEPCFRSWGGSHMSSHAGRTLHLEASLASKPTGLEVGGMEGCWPQGGQGWAVLSQRWVCLLPSAQTRHSPRARGAADPGLNIPLTYYILSSCFMGSWKRCRLWGSKPWLLRPVWALGRVMQPLRASISPAILRMADPPIWPSHVISYSTSITSLNP